jgi:chromosome segregation ATPase
MERSTKYVIKNSGSETKNVLVEFPIDLAWTLTTPKEPSEKTRDLYRFAVKAEPGKPAELTIALERPIVETVVVSNLNNDVILGYVNRRETSAKVKDALRDLIRRKTEIAELQQRRNVLAQDNTTITQDQDRIRQNMQTIDRNTDLYARYLKTFTDQEDKLESHRQQIRDLDKQIQQAQNALDAYLGDLELV